MRFDAEGHQLCNCFMRLDQTGTCFAIVLAGHVHKDIISVSCNETKRSGQEHEPRRESYGNDALRVSLWPEGTVVFHSGGPGFVLPDGSLSMKFGWWRHARGKLTIKGKRLDSPAPPIRADIPEGYGDRGFQATAIIFPTEGCWELTGKVGTATLTFVTRVIKERGAGNR